MLERARKYRSFFVSVPPFSGALKDGVELVIGEFP
jgi:hypothetical protein